ncbi:MAG: helix-turn-helix domain-containing protein [Clostridia bacterium]|nr:helix-turn-helix domain-containing protein [Clostridia bacterium]
MRLGENIYRLRTERGMSQGDLADTLSVSRQSVSKWETDGATPDLDKLLKLSQLFGITLDELVTGESAPLPEPELQSEPEPKVIYVERTEPTVPKRKIAGYALFGMAILVVLLCTLLGGMLAGVLFSFPFWVCGSICFLLKEHIGLWCSWALFAITDIYMRYASGISWMNPYALIQHMIRDWNIRWIISIVFTLLLTVLIAFTIRAYRQKVLEPCRKVTVQLLCMGAVVVVMTATPFAMSSLLQQYATNGQSLYTITRIFQIVNLVTSWTKVLLLCRIVIDLFALRRWKRQQTQS